MLNTSQFIEINIINSRQKQKTENPLTTYLFNIIIALLYTEACQTVSVQLGVQKSTFKVVPFLLQSSH